VFLGARARLHSSFPDPAQATGTEEEQLAVYRSVRDAIRARIEQELIPHLGAQGMRSRVVHTWVARERAVGLHSPLARNLLHSAGVAGMGKRRVHTSWLQDGVDRRCAA
jgi:hypothetical protein